MTFQIDGGNVAEPISFSWEERFSPFKDSNGMMIVSAYRSAIASFNTLELAEFAAWIAACDELLHSITVFSPLVTSTATYTNCIIEHMAGDISNGLYFYGSEFRVRHVSTVTFTAFGAI
jgi:hypothetical protein